MNERFLRRAAVVLALAFACVSCRTQESGDMSVPPPASSGSEAPASSGKFAPGQSVALRGTLGTGAECPTLTVDAGRLFSLAGDLGRFKPGDQVCVRGTIAEMSICMAGEATIAVTSVAPADSCPK